MEKWAASSKFAHGCSYLDQNIDVSVKVVNYERHEATYLLPDIQYSRVTWVKFESCMVKVGCYYSDIAR